jgi:hypothetical protein
MRTPLGIVILGLLAGMLGATLLLALAAMSGAQPGMVGGRAAVAVLAVLAFVAAEALIWLRPWFFRASLWLVVGICAEVLGVSVAVAGGVGVGVGLTLVLLSMAFFVPILIYVRSESVKTARPTRHPRTAPPPPWPAPGRTP